MMTDRYTIGHGAGYLGRKPECWRRSDGSLAFPADMTMGDAREYVRGFEDGKARRERGSAPESEPSEGAK